MFYKPRIPCIQGAKGSSEFHPLKKTAGEKRISNIEQGMLNYELIFPFDIHYSLRGVGSTLRAGSGAGGLVRYSAVLFYNALNLYGSRAQISHDTFSKTWWF
jgi:hypothetical protein